MHARTRQIDRCGAVEKTFLESRAGQDHVERHPRRQVHERHHARPPNEVRVVNPQREAGCGHVAGEAFGAYGTRASVTSTSALRRGTPYRMTACAPNTYQRPQRVRTGASAASRSRAAGWSGTAKDLDHANVELEVVAPERSAGPGGILQEGLPAKFLGDAEALERTETGDAITPVKGLVIARGLPIPGDELVNAARDHTTIVPSRATIRPPRHARDECGVHRTARVAGIPSGIDARGGVPPLSRAETSTS